MSWIRLRNELEIYAIIMFQNLVCGLVATCTFSKNNSNTFYGLAFNSDHKDIESIFQDFWEMGNISSDGLLSKEEDFCKTHF